MADEPVVAQVGPYKLEMEPGTYWWCACGRSASQPFWDSSHKVTSFQPREVVIAAKTVVAWCGCKHSQRGERCDGTHRTLVADGGAR